MLTAAFSGSQPAVSRHLAVLILSGLVRDRRAGGKSYYSAVALALAPLINWTALRGAFWRERFGGLSRS